MMSGYIDRSKDIGPFVPRKDDNIIICRCEEITKGEIRMAVHMGLWTMNEVKRMLRPGMGLCQGQTCSKNVKNIIADELGISASFLDEATARPPVRPIEMVVFGNEVEKL